MVEKLRTPGQIGNAIRRQRKKLGLSQSELGEKVGLRQGTISQIETGHPAARMDTLLAILGALDLELRLHTRSQPDRARDIEDLIG